MKLQLHFFIVTPLMIFLALLEIAPNWTCPLFPWLSKTLCNSMNLIIRKWTIWIVQDRYWLVILLIKPFDEFFFCFFHLWSPGAYSGQNFKVSIRILWPILSNSGILLPARATPSCPKFANKPSSFVVWKSDRILHILLVQSHYAFPSQMPKDSYSL